MRVLFSLISIFSNCCLLTERSSYLWDIFWYNHLFCSVFLRSYPRCFLHKFASLFQGWEIDRKGASHERVDNIPLWVQVNCWEWCKLHCKPRPTSSCNHFCIAIWLTTSWDLFKLFFCIAIWLTTSYSTYHNVAFFHE